MFTARFWRETAERAIKSAAQAAILVIGGDQLNAWGADWGNVAGFAVGGAVLSLLTSIGSNYVGPAETPSVVD